MLGRVSDFETREEYLANAHGACEAFQCALATDSDVFATLLDGERPPVVALTVSALSRLRRNATVTQTTGCEQWVLEALEDAHCALAELALRAACRVLATRPGPLVRIADLATWLTGLVGALECAFPLDHVQFITNAWMPCCDAVANANALYRRQLASVVVPEAERLVREQASLIPADLAAVLGLARAAGLAPSVHLYSHAASLMATCASSDAKVACLFLAHLLVSADESFAKELALSTTVDTNALSAATGVHDAPIFSAVLAKAKPGRRIDAELARFLDEGLRISAQASANAQSLALDDDAFSDGADSDTRDVDISTRTNCDGISGMDERLLQAYIRDRSAFGRSAAVRSGAARRALIAATGLAHEQLEGWAIVFERNPNADAVARDYAIVHPDRV